jgi:prolipoprotein diacylglyceryltransferase
MIATAIVSGVVLSFYLIDLFLRRLVDGIPPWEQRAALTGLVLWAMTAGALVARLMVVLVGSA